MLLDRQLQLELMSKMAEVYPSSYDFSDQIKNSNEDQLKRSYANLYYLQSHELLEPKSIHLRFELGGSGSRLFTLGLPRLTEKGADFMANDGGLSAILGVVTVKFEADTLKAILENRINQSDLAPDDKKSMIDALRELPAESIKHLTMKLLDEGLENLPSAILLIGTYLGIS
ncbi:hypothetical protein J506_2866 [Acinetobacter baumannii 625974]|uniref:Uncharacterized protein n=1 Tax=Acinetobacter baumannii 625974 TaxID=1310607 RepID=A0A009Q8A6_ACIBA|nr:hypothetical protein [Acinetobacter baumannii]EXC06112.1 hypothetical protein J506_2866 [Acinetobacter baumannii 625974]OTM14457.1 hypothetical protein B9X54_09270 [Acinetobacter baumannii]OTU21012.1 hypothetical protein CAT61_16140 [Acinetobacter baumannii]